MPHIHPNCFYWGHQCSWTLTPANSMQVSIMQPDEVTRPKATFKPIELAIVYYNDHPREFDNKKFY